ncbi:tetratricopeptide repeat protein [Streptomyces mirabilis]|uniref:tetratricopeptide repeat protein n=1 Tax=Streptomyces mirabilis TaxID=68239 RepID=UPI0036DA44ED
MTRYWTQALPFSPLAEKCLAVLSGSAPADGYLIELADFAWQGARAVMGEGWPADARLSIAGAGTAETALALAGSDGLVTVSLARLRALGWFSLELAEHVSRNFARALVGTANLPDLVELNGFEERALPNPDSPWYAPDTGLLVDDLMRSAGAAVLQEPQAPSQALPRFDLGLLTAELRDGHYDLLFDPANGPYVIRLHHHVFVNALLFALMHEAAHLSLEHFHEDESVLGVQRQREVDADAEALERLAGDPGGDPRAAISILRYAHAAEPEPTGAQLSHPHSADRLALLAEAIRSTDDAALAQDINETLRELVSPGGRANDEQGHTAELLISSDLDAAYVEARVREKVTDGTLGAWDRTPRIAVRAEVRHRDLVDAATVFAAATVHIYFAEKVHTTFDGEVLTHISRARIPIPPAWRLRWPNARLTITSITDIPREVGPEDMTALQVMLDKKRAVVWNQPDEELLGLDDLVAGEPVRADARSLLEWARWCEEYGFSGESLFLRATVVEQAPMHMPAHVVSGVLEELLSVDDVVRAHRLALCYVEQTARTLPGVQYTCALHAINDGDRLAAFDHAFAETHGFGQGDGFGSAAGSLCMQIIADGGDEPDLAELLDFFRLYGRYTSARGRRSKRKYLAQAQEILSHRLSTRAVGLLSVRQLRAEACASAWRLGEPEADVTAAQIFEQIIAGDPWFVAASAQMAHLCLDQGDREAALQCLRNAELTAPAHPQLMGVRQRLLQATT